ncbi:T9SS type A sorting domain-containing protein [Vicingaceae bacterium]|nr:T9SS type A sorting domain-containing protein [Vicingaceae bacterium]
MNKIIIILFFLCPVFIAAQTYTHPTVNLQNTNLGACMVNTCSGTYYDDGGAGGDYTGIGQVYRTFCPDAVGECVTFDFNSYDIEASFNMMGVQTGCFDAIYLLDGATQANFLGPICGTAAASAITYTSTDASGCLGLWFQEDGSVYGDGWDISISCDPCATGPNGTDDNDCSSNTPVCEDTPISSTSTGPGLESTCSDCMISENYSTWYHIIIQTAGDFEMEIVPTNGTDDYDFAVFESDDCASLGAATRCSYAAGTSTGFTAGQTGTSEDVLGDSYLEPITSVAIGDEFFICINDWSGTGGGYTLSWGGTASLDCAVLPVELLSFVARPYDRYIELNWTTAVELSLERYDIEKLLDGKWVKILDSKPAGDNSFYSTTDIYPIRGENIYRLKSLDLNGEHAYSDVISVNYNKEMFDIFIGPSSLSINSTDIPIESIQIFNVLGQEIHNLRFEEIEKSTKFILDLDQLPTNTYIIRVNDIEGKMFIKYY